jgi:L-fuculose-phosphate aldolase
VLSLDAARRLVAETGRRLAASGMVPGTSGNVSVRVDDVIAITPTGAALAELTAEQIPVIDLDGRLVDGRLAPTSELDLHLGAYRHRDAGAVVHTHAPGCTAVACVRDDLPCIHYAMLTFGGAVRVAPYATFGTPELAANVVAALDGRTAALMSNHGAVTIGATLTAAYESMELLEWACTVFRYTSALGEPRILDERQLAAAAEAMETRQYAATHAVTTRPSPGSTGPAEPTVSG